MPEPVMPEPVMQAGAMRRGACPTLFAPMRSGDGWLVRVRPSASRLTSDAARGLARMALRHGNGAIELTNRGNLQLRGFGEASAATFARDAVAQGLAVDRRHGVVVSPMAGDDPDCEPGTLEVAARLEAAIEADAGLDALPAKFVLAVDGGGAIGLGSLDADIVLRAGGGAWQVEAGDRMTVGAASDAPGWALRLARASLALEPGLRPSRRPACGTALFQAAGLAHRPRAARDDRPPVAIGALAQGGFGIGVPPGRLDASLLLELAELAARFGDGTLRLTPWRAILLAGIDARGVTVLRAALGHRLIDPMDPRLRTLSCIGAPACARGSVPAPADADRVADAVPKGSFVHVSGCAKGCAHPGPAPWTLVGDGGRYDLVQGGCPGDGPVRRGMTIEAVRTMLRAGQAP